MSHILPLASSSLHQVNRASVILEEHHLCRCTFFFLLSSPLYLRISSSSPWPAFLCFPHLRASTDLVQNIRWVEMSRIRSKGPDLRLSALDWGRRAFRTVRNKSTKYPSLLIAWNKILSLLWQMNCVLLNNKILFRWLGKTQLHRYHLVPSCDH